MSGASFDRVPGGKGANQAVAAARLGADVRFVGAVAVDDLADEALAGLEEAGIDTDGVQRISEPDLHTGVALIFVDTMGENEIVVAPGANAYLSPERIDVADADARHQPARDPRRRRLRRRAARPASSASTPLPHVRSTSSPTCSSSTGSSTR